MTLHITSNGSVLHLRGWQSEVVLFRVSASDAKVENSVSSREWELTFDPMPDLGQAKQRLQKLVRDFASEAVAGGIPVGLMTQSPTDTTILTCRLRLDNRL